MVGALVLVAGGIAVFSAGEDEKVTVGTEAPDGSSSSAGEVQPVSVTGTAVEPYTGESPDPMVGTAAPTISGFTFDGSPVAIDWSKGPTMLVYLAHWCPHCNREVPRLVEWKASGAVPANLQVIGVTTAVTSTRDHYPPSTWIEGFGWDWPVLADSVTDEAAVAMGLSGYPYTIIVGSDGKVLARTSGEVEIADLKAFVASALGSTTA